MKPIQVRVDPSAEMDCLLQIFDPNDNHRPAFGNGLAATIEGGPWDGEVYSFAGLARLGARYAIRRGEVLFIYRLMRNDYGFRLGLIQRGVVAEVSIDNGKIDLRHPS